MLRLLRLSLLAALVASTAWPLDVSKLQPQGYLSDFAGVVDGASRQSIEQYCSRVEASTGAQIALVTLNTLEGEPIEDVANQLFRAWGVGKKETNEGILLLLVIQDRRSRLEVGYGLEPIIPDGYAGSLLREMRPALREGRYAEAMAVAAQQIGDRIGEKKGVQVEALPRRQRPASGQREGFPWPVLVGLAALVLWMTAAKRNVRRVRRSGFRSADDALTTLLLGSILGRGMHGGGSHGRSRGGFGGFDSFDGFGGFGGGDSGGGGASSSW
ncbi:MAG: TPM domain-containing protein [Bryobacteraceae bacterium]|nr:TPM domain-containing protein [Bryobacteraceae bacterium]